MMTESKVLSDCGTCLVLDDTKDNRYEIEIAEGDYLFIEVGNKVNTPSANFSHPNICATRKKIYEFKHYRNNGGKFWTRSAGLSFYFIIPKTAIKILPEKGYSYIKAEINGVKVSFNVSGGGGSGVWTDYLGNSTQISVGHKLADLKKLAEVAIRNPELESKIKFEKLDENELKRWSELKISSDSKLKETIGKLVEEGLKPVIQLGDRWSYCGRKQGIGVSVNRRCKKTNVEKMENGTTHYNLEWIGALRNITIALGDSAYERCRLKLSQIDWSETAKLNHLV